MKLVLLSAFGLLLVAGCGLPESSAIAQAQAVPPAEKPAESAAAPAAAPLPAVSTNTAATPAAPPIPQLPPNLPEAAREIVKLSHSQVDDGVVTNFIANIDEPFHLDAEQIVYLRDLGLSAAVLEALLAREQQLGGAPKSAAPTAASPPPAPVPAPAVTAVTAYPGGKPELAPPQVSPAVETAPAAEPPPAAPSQVNYNFFYDSLAPYGNWFSIPTYGYVWQPTCAVITPGWRPYWNSGCWNWCDSGWYWNSYYSWGWAPFHYGNWVNAPGNGWCWVPGSTWSPSWVTFRYGGGYCGWAPLPPGCGVSAGVGLTWGGAGVGLNFGFGYAAGDYCWTPTSYFTAPNCWAYGVYGAGINQAYNNSTVINNYVVGNNNTIINGGIAPDKISRGEIRKMQLADASTPNGAGLAPGRGRPGSDNTLPVYRPVVGAPRGATGSGTAGGGTRQEVRPTSLASRSSGLSPSAGSLARRPVLNQPDRLPAPNPRTPAVALHSGNGSRGGSAVLGGRTGSARPGAITSVTPGAVGRPGGNGTAPLQPSLISRGGTPNGTLPRPAAPSGRLEPRKPPVASVTPNPGLPGSANPGQGFGRPNVGGPAASLQPRNGGSRQTPQFQPSPASRFNPRPNMGSPAPMPSYRAPSVQRMAPAPSPSVSMSRPSGGFGGGARGGGGGGGGAVLRGRP